MESLLGRVVVMVVVGVIGGSVAILLIRAESEQRKAAAASHAGTASVSLEENGGENFQNLDWPTTNSNQDLDQNGGSVNEMSNLLNIPGGKHSDLQRWQQQLPQNYGQLEERILMTSHVANDVIESDSDIIDELLLTLRRKLLSYDEDEKELRRKKRDVSEHHQEVRRSKKIKREASAITEQDEWQEDTDATRNIPSEKAVDDAERTWRQSTGSHRIRHSRRKPHHRQYDSRQDSGTYIPRSFEVGEMDNSITALGKTATALYKTATVPTQNVTTVAIYGTNKTQGVAYGRISNRFDNLTNINIMGNITHIKTPKDILEDENNVATEIREALLLAVPLSLLLTVILLICVACCCCRYRTHLAYSDHLSYAMREEDEFIEEWPTLNLGVCEVCLPDISYQAHLAQKIKNSKKRRAGDQIELVLEGETMESEAREEGIKCHPPLYTLLSNLPPGSSHLEDDQDFSYDSVASSRPRRSQSLEFLTV